RSFSLFSSSAKRKTLLLSRAPLSLLRRRSLCHRKHPPPHRTAPLAAIPQQQQQQEQQPDRRPRGSSRSLSRRALCWAGPLRPLIRCSIATIPRSRRLPVLARPLFPVIHQGLFLAAAAA